MKTTNKNAREIEEKFFSALASMIDFFIMLELEEAQAEKINSEKRASELTIANEEE